MSARTASKPEYSERSGHPIDRYYCHDQSQGYSSATSLNEMGRSHRAAGHLQGTWDNPWKPPAADDEHIRPNWNRLSPVDDLISGRLDIERPLKELTNGISATVGAATNLTTTAIQILAPTQNGRSSS